VAYPLFDDVDRRLIGALQVDGRASPEQLAEALDLPVRTVGRPDVPFVDIASTSEEIGAFVAAGDGARSRLLSGLAGSSRTRSPTSPRRPC